MDPMEFIIENHILSSGSCETQASLAESAQLLEIKKGEHLFHDKEPVDRLYFVVEGHFTLYKLNNLGEKRIIFILGKGNLLNDSVRPSLTTSVSAKAFNDGRVLSIPKKTMLSLMEKDHKLTMAILDTIEHKVRRLHRQLKNSSGSIRMDRRLAAKLWKLSKDYGVETDEGICIDLDLTHHFIADLLGTKRETISRQMKVLTDLGLIITSKGQIIIPSREDLMEFFQGL